PVVPAVARQREGIPELIQAIDEIATGQTVCKPHRIRERSETLERAIGTLAEKVEAAFPGMPNTRWVALRLLEGDTRIVEAVRSGELGDLRQDATGSDAAGEVTS
ncbi:MAG: iron transporter FeoB, partial [Candidatus Latescibacteria bacterium]|nr:iron transporter FeoB [Candidatus Latescibacterota bacterium]